MSNVVGEPRTRKRTHRRFIEEPAERQLKRDLADEITSAMRAADINKVEMAKRMMTSRRQLDRLLNPSERTITLYALVRVASALGRKLSIRLD